MSAAKASAPVDQVLTANRLSDGKVVFFSADGGWDERIDRARVVAKADGEALMAAAAGTVGEVVEPYLIDVDIVAEGGSAGPVPRRYRERIRAFGPSIHPQFAK
ncbi:MAG: DUF2849 domain-containing protein [Rhodospirillales bacterium]|nr:DUF2849 domain-containing protein [Rhodospirillales bacterium]